LRESTCRFRLFFAGTLLVFLLTSCGDDNAMVTVYDKSILKTPVSCMKLQVFPENKMIEETMRHLYHFDPSCSLKLNISYKNGITCNSTFNVQTKSMNGFPSSYLNMELREGLSLKYSYYIDLQEEVSPEDLEKGFERMKQDLIIK
jgi:hypothetical protein